MDLNRVETLTKLVMAWLILLIDDCHLYEQGYNKF
jgi:hypothetical protein